MRRTVSAFDYLPIALDLYMHLPFSALLTPVGYLIHVGHIHLREAFIALHSPVKLKELTDAVPTFSNVD